MSKKNDMYIDYKRSNKKRGKKGLNKYWITMLVIFLICLGLTAYFIILSRGGYNKNKTSKEQSVTLVPTNRPTNAPVIIDPTSKPNDMEEPETQPTQKAKPTNEVTITPEPTPAKATTNDDLLHEKTDGSGNPDSIRGIYVPAKVAGSNRIDKLIQMVDATEINAMVIDVKGDEGRISFDIDSNLAKNIGANTDTISDIKTLVQRLKEKNIYLIARVVAFKDPYLAKKRPDLAIKNKDGSLYKDNNGECWINPYNKTVWNYLVNIASQSAAVGFDEIQFDYIRFCTSKGIANADLGNQAITKSKETIITEFTKFAYGRLKPLGVSVSADVYGTIIASSVDAKIVGQNFVQMSKYLDYICPMIYPSHFGEGNFGIQYPDQEPFKIISKVLSISATKLKEIPKDKHRAVVRPWLQDFTASWVPHHINYGGDELREEIEGVYSVGYDEWLLWNAGCEYSEDGLLEK